jgi:hypothetical protein
MQAILVLVVAVGTAAPAEQSCSSPQPAAGICIASLELEPRACHDYAAAVHAGTVAWADIDGAMYRVVDAVCVGTTEEGSAGSTGRD